jgi:hypothetical protein
MSDAHSQPASGSPPSAAGELEPYGIRVAIHLGSQPFEGEAFLVRLLEDLASACVESGATVIGHLKCLLNTPGGIFGCSLTSLRSGAVCAWQGEGDPARALDGVSERWADVEHAPACEAGARLDLAVLVYGLTAEAIDVLVEDTLDAVLTARGAWWSRCL